MKKKKVYHLFVDPLLETEDEMTQRNESLYEFTTSSLVNEFDLTLQMFGTL